MKTEHLTHRHGGKITAITAIVHAIDSATRKPYWDFIGDVEWHDGTKSQGVHIAPICVCWDPQNEAEASEGRPLMAKLNDYLHEHGQWDLETHDWKPGEPEGRVEI